MAAALRCVTLTLTHLTLDKKILTNVNLSGLPIASALSTGQKIKPQLKPLILGSAGNARATQNQGFSGF
ncbi:hypothetical protein [Vacuolonema iberomarrocanum]|uniref:hypothetical protein n=1 Tax=Vacuolonema iberomarrocanum TaxID=3454632 RepID=UPI001A024D14|nr:hypothetical protein [filamentous cyanobacterium LEGE 07170]